MKFLVNGTLLTLFLTQICFAQPVPPPASQGGWFWQNPKPTGNSLYNVSIVDQNVGWAVGSAGTILHTTNGSDWILQSSGISRSLYSSYFLNKDTGWVSGSRGLILKTTNGGSNWNLLVSDISTNLNSIFFVDANVGWVVGDTGKVYKTTNGGLSWESKSSNTSEPLYSVFFIDQYKGWTAGGAILSTTDGGENWQPYLAGFKLVYFFTLFC